MVKFYPGLLHTMTVVFRCHKNKNNFGHERLCAICPELVGSSGCAFKDSAFRNCVQNPK